MRWPRPVENRPMNCLTKIRTRENLSLRRHRTRKRLGEGVWVASRVLHLDAPTPAPLPPGLLPGCAPYPPLLTPLLPGFVAILSASSTPEASPPTSSGSGPNCGAPPPTVPVLPAARCEAPPQFAPLFGLGSLPRVPSPGLGPLPPGLRSQPTWLPT